MMSTRRDKNRKGVFLNVYSEDWEAFKTVCALRGKTIREAMTDLLEPEICRCKRYLESIPDYETMLLEDDTRSRR